VRNPFLILLILAGTAHADRLVETREVVRGDYLAPHYSPDGQQLLLTGPKLAGLFLAPVLGGAVQRLTDEPEAGVLARWNPDGSVAYRAARAGARRDLIIDRAGTVHTFEPQAVAFAQDDRMYVMRAGQLVQIGNGDRFYGAVVAPDGDKVVFNGLTTGLYLYTRSTGKLVHIGDGTAPAWSPDGGRIVFELTEDDGHNIVASELYIYDVPSGRVSQLTTTDRVIERRPSFSADGTHVAFDDNAGGIFVGRVEVRP
jgi:Tol biopolymer transport system component